MKKFLAIGLFWLSIACSLQAQRSNILQVKTDLINWAFLQPNLECELGFSPGYSLVAGLGTGSPYRDVWNFGTSYKGLRQAWGARLGGKFYFKSRREPGLRSEMAFKPLIGYNHHAQDFRNLAGESYFVKTHSIVGQLMLAATKPLGRLLVVEINFGLGLTRFIREYGGPNPPENLFQSDLFYISVPVALQLGISL